jgi:hypothetical protein
MVLSNAETQNLKNQVIALPYASLLTRQTEVQSRLSSITIQDSTPKQSSKPLSSNNDASKDGNIITSIPKTDTHWDFVMKELAWLATDFQSERKRQKSLAKKQALSIKQYHSTKEKRALRKIAELELKKRRLASKLARDVVKGWWEKKIERVIAYKQKVDADLVRKRGMDRHLVFLVKQTERYTDLLNQQLVQTHHHDSGNEVEQMPALTIEQALRQNDFESCARNKRQRHLDYQTIAERIGSEVKEFYGESTEDEGGSEMEDYIPSQDEEPDDETTLIEAEEMDAVSNQNLRNEIEILEEESRMSIEDLLKRFEAERDQVLVEQEPEQDTTDKRTTRARSRSKRVKFASEISVEEAKVAASTATSATKLTMNDGNDADDDADMSDVDDFASLADSVGSNASNGSDEFASNPLDCVDDESTLDAEMRLKPDISAQEELALLQREADMSVEELQAMYAGASGAGDQNDDKNDINANRNADSNMGSASSSSEDFEDDGQAVDDERTIAAEELLGRDMPYDDEIALLQRENEMSIEELKAMYHNVQADSGDDDVDPKESAEEDIGSVTSDSQDEGEFEPATGADIDDETTIDAEERLGREITHQEEIDMLQKESEMPIEQLRAMYANQDAGMAENDDDESMSPHDSLDQTYATSESKKRKLELETGKVEDEEEDEGAAAIKSLEYADEKARNTAVSRPYLIPSWVKLRKYQHVGLNWLVSIQTRRLNGILADEMVSHRSLFFEAFLTLVCLSNFRLRRSPGSW